MSRHHDKLIQSAAEAAAQAGQPPPRTAPRTREEVESFVRGFGLSAPATRRIVAEWIADTDRARTVGYSDGYESGADDQSY